ncbi:MAG TPA: ribosomal protein S18-alanine N-acetyltransferase [Syntrophomonadaceae bacterium]|nr:ribosomal protein S18-alanine N-acetyltransferase [Syntrophomonadaceae bacterium]
MLQTNYLVREMKASDVDEVIGIEREAFTLPWSKESYLADLRNDFATYLVCDYAGQVAGYAGMWVVFYDAHITNVAVAKEYRNQGIGKMLLMGLEKVAKEKEATRMMLEVRPSNYAAIHLYKSIGFKPYNIRKNYYSDNGEDAIVMTKLVF